MINEEACLMPDLKGCKHFMPWFDALFVRDQELWFGRYNAAVKADPDTITLITYSVGASVSMLKEDALCFFDKGSHRWVMILSEHSRISWQVNTEDDEINLRILASIAEDELKGSRGDHNDFAITNRIKNRYRTWFEERNLYRRMVRDRINTVYGLAPATIADLNADERPKPYQHKKIHVNPPQPKFVQFNGDYTTVVWKDGSHTIVKRAEGECYDEEKAIMFAVLKHMCKDNGCEMTRYFDSFYKHSRDISNDKEKKNGSNKKVNTKGNSRKA